MNNNFGRTVSKKIKLRLKGFHRRVMAIEVVKSLLDCDVKPPPIKLLGASSSGGRSNIAGGFTYTLEELKASGGYSSSFGRQQSFKKTFQRTFNKSQLIGKVVFVGDIRYKVKEKQKYIGKGFYY